MPRDLMTIRLDPSLRLRLQQTARRRGVTPSASVRLAIQAWLAADDARAETRPYDEVADLLGRVDERVRPGRARSLAPQRRRGTPGGAR